MKKLANIMVVAFFMLILSLAFYGCQIFGVSKYSEEEKAELVGEAVAGGGTVANSSNKAPVTVNTDTGGTITYDDSVNSSVLQGSDYYSDIGSWGAGTLYFSLTYSKLQETVKDLKGNNVTVVLNGTLYWASNVTIDDQTGDLSGKMIFYGTTSGTVDGEAFEDYTIDIKFEYTYSSGSHSFEGSITGTVNGKTIKNTVTYSATTGGA